MTNNESDLQQSRVIHSDDEFVKIREIVMHHKVCWEVWPEYYIDRSQKKVQIGFELDLMGTIGAHDHPEQIYEPGRVGFMKILNDLKLIAQCIIPKDKRDCRSEILVFNTMIQYAARRGFRKDFTVGIKILHSEGFDRPIDACADFLKEIEKKLKELGAHNGHWKESTISGGDSKE